MRARGWLIALCALCLADVSAARLLLWTTPQIDMPRAERERLALLDCQAAERSYRIQSDVYDHDLAKSFDGTACWGPFRYHIVTNSLGFRDGSRRSVALASTRPRVLLFGDSFTEGLGVDFAETYAGLITKRLGPGVEVLNAAVTSYSPAIYYAKARYLIDEAGLECSQVVVFIDISDAEDEARYYDLHSDGHISRMADQRPGRGSDIDGLSGDTFTAPPTLSASGLPRQTIDVDNTNGARVTKVSEPTQWRLALRRHSVLVRAWDMLAAPRDETAYPKGNPRRGLWTVDERDYQAFGRIGLELGAHHMDRLLELLRAHRISLTIAVYPWPEQVRYDRPDSIQVRFWRDWAARHGVAFVDLFEPFFGSPDRAATVRQYYIPGDVHFSREGHRLVATTFMARFALSAANPL